MNKPKNVIVVLSDSLRRDHLGCYGNATIRTPNIDAFAAHSLIFDNHYCASFPTMPARADLFTGKYTFAFLGWNPLPEGETSLPQLLGSSGYTTAASVDTPFYARKGFNYDRGFDVFLENYGQRILAFSGGTKHYDYRRFERRYEEDYFAPKTFASARHWLEQQYTKDKPFFLLVDTWDPHEPWDPPVWYSRIYKPDHDGRIVDPTYSYVSDSNLSDDDIEKAHASYCGEITMVDTHFGQFINLIDTMSLDEDTIVIFTSDHGFYFGEHGIFGKAIRIKPGSKSGHRMRVEDRWYRSPLYGEDIRIPLLLRVPGLGPGRISALTSATDIMPTILNLIGAEIPSDVHGVSLAPTMSRRGEKAVHDYVVSSFPLVNPGDETAIVDAFSRKASEFLPATVTTRDWSLIYSARGEKAELYNLTRDPLQLEDCFAENQDVAKEMHAHLVDLLESKGVDPRLLRPRLSF